MSIDTVAMKLSGGFSVIIKQTGSGCMVGGAADISCDVSVVLCERVLVNDISVWVHNDAAGVVAVDKDHKAELVSALSAALVDSPGLMDGWVAGVTADTVSNSVVDQVEYILLVMFATCWKSTVSVNMVRGA